MSSSTAEESPPGTLPQDVVVLIFSRLPTDIVVDIISRLPLRSLIRFGCVCKSWYALLKNPDFISRLFIQTTTSNASAGIPNNYFIFLRVLSPTSYRRTLSLLSCTESFDVPTDMHIHFAPQFSYTICGSSNGLVCLSAMPTLSIIILWNPLTRVFKDLPVSPVIRPRVNQFEVVLGFGFDSVVNDYKLIRIVHYTNHQDQVEIYSLSTNSWREIKGNVGCRITEYYSRVMTRGRLHWEVCEYSTNKEVIVTFDMNNEVFNHIQLPNGVTGLYRYYADSTNQYVEDDFETEQCWHLVVLKGDCLGLISYRVTSNKCNLDIWVMDEYGVAESWTRYFSLEDDTRPPFPLGFKNHGEATEVLLYKDDEDMVVYDSLTQSLETIVAHVDPGFHSEVFSYRGTLSTIEGGKTVREAVLRAIVPDPFFTGRNKGL